MRSRETLRRLAERAQVVTITHLPQIASLADRHFRVEKVPGDPTHTRIEQLDDAERRDELERMLGGAEFLATLGEVRASSTGDGVTRLASSASYHGPTGGGHRVVSRPPAACCPAAAARAARGR